MSIKEYKKLPKGYTYLVSKKEIKQFVSEYSTCSFDIWFVGTDSKKTDFAISLNTYYSLTPVSIRAYRDEDNAWLFELRIYGQRNEYISDNRQMVSSCILKQSKKWIDSKLAIPPLAGAGKDLKLIYSMFDKQTKELIEEKT